MPSSFTVQPAGGATGGGGGGAGAGIGSNSAKGGNLCILTRTAHPGLQIAGRVEKMEVIALVDGVSPHGIGHDARAESTTRSCVVNWHHDLVTVKFTSFTNVKRG